MRNKNLQELLANYPDDIDVGTVALTGRQTITGAFVVGHPGDERLLLEERMVKATPTAVIPTETDDQPESNGTEGPDDTEGSPAK